MKVFSFVLLFMLMMVVPVVASEVRISAAASLTDVLKELVADYRQQHPDVELLPNFASSGALARQIEAGAPADIYISANAKWSDYLQQQGVIDAGTQRVMVRNSLVFLGPPESKVTSLLELPALQRIAIGSPKSVPAGQYAEQALTAAGIYAELLAAGKLIFAKDVRQALLYADRGEVDGAFVYRTDALLARHAKILFAVPQELYPPVVYPAALLKTATEKAEAKEFFNYLFSPAARPVFGKYGFFPAE
jgi:molybdate transport system substrate-binding protein